MSLSPVSCDSSTPTSPSTRRPSSTIWSPALTAIRSPSTRSSGRTSVDLARSDGRRRRPREQRDPVEGPLGADLLDDADEDVGRDDGQRDEGVDRAADGDEGEPEGEQDVVDEGEDVLAQDLRVGPRGRRRRRVAVAGGAPAGDLRVVEARLGRRGQVRAAPGSSRAGWLPRWSHARAYDAGRAPGARLAGPHAPGCSPGDHCSGRTAELHAWRAIQRFSGPKPVS